MKKTQYSEKAYNNRLAYSREYIKNNIKTLRINLNVKTDSDIIEHLSKFDVKQAYIKELIRKDMKK